MNLVDEICNILDSCNLNFDDVVFVVNSQIIGKEEFLDKFDLDYDGGWGSCNFENIQVIVDDYTWFERTSYDGCEKFILKAHPILSRYENQESHTKYFYG